MKTKILTAILLLAFAIGYGQIKVIDTENSGIHWLEQEHDTDHDCLSPENHKLIKARIEKSAQNMIKAGVLEKNFSADQRLNHPLFIWPMRQADGFNDPGYYTISNYVDLDTDTTVLDYNGNTQSYNGHKGIDIRTAPYFWKKMNDSHVEVIAADAGVIIFKDDQWNDNSCQSPGATLWNAVYLLHADGAITWYGHLKTNSATEKDSGDLVNAGEFLGIVGSSGNSTNPHLHFEVNDNMGNLIEPFFGPWNGTTDDSWWVNQLPYYDSAINKIATHSANPITPACPGIEIPNEKYVFNHGNAITFSIAIRHSLTSDVMEIEVFEPDGDQSNILDLTYQRPGPPLFSKAPLLTWNRVLDFNAEPGKWTYRVTYNSSSYAPQVVESNFWVKNLCEANIIHNQPLTEDAYYQASNTITSRATINNNNHIVYDAENVTRLLPGFRAPVGSKLEIKLDGCF